MSNQFHGYPPTNNEESNSSNNQNNAYTPPPQYQPPKYTPPVKTAAFSCDKRTQILIVSITFIAATIFSICSGGMRFYGEITYPIMTTIISILFMVLSNITGYVKNKKAFLLAVPILLFSLPSAILGFTSFSIFNVIIVNFLYATMAMLSLHEEKQSVFTFSFLGNIFATIFTNLKHSRIIFSWNKREKVYKGTVVKRVLIGVLISIPILSIIIGLLCQADPMFAHVFREVFRWFKYIFSFEFFGYVICGILAWIYFASYFINAKIKKRRTPQTATSTIKADTVISATILALVNFVFIVFCYVQFAYLFRGQTVSDVVINYADYARQGFFQLLFVTVINFVMVLIFNKLLKNMEYKMLIKILLAVLCLCTAVLIYSSFYRINLYISRFGFTIMRGLVVTFLLMESVLVVITIVMLFMNKRNLANTYIPVMLAFFLIANFTGSEWLNTKMNIKRYIDTGNYTDGYFYQTGKQSQYLAKDFLNELDNLSYEDVEDVRKDVIRAINGSYRTKRYWQNYNVIDIIGRIQHK